MSEAPSSLEAVTLVASIFAATMLLLGTAYLVIVRVFTTRTTILVVIGLIALAGALAGRYARGKIKTKTEELICDRCHVEMAELSCDRCHRWVGPRCSFAPTRFCIDCATCTVCGAGFAEYYCGNCFRTVCSSCLDRFTRRCIICSGSAKQAAGPIVKEAKAKVLVAEAELDISPEIAANLGPRLKDNLTGKELQIGDRVEALGTHFRVVATSPIASKVTVMDRTHVIAVSPDQMKTKRQIPTS